MLNKKLLILFIASVVSLLCLTHIPQSEMPVDIGTFNLDKLLHVIAYGSVTILMFAALGAKSSLIFWFIATALLMVLGGVDEYTQPYVGRTCSLADWLADAVGIIGAAIVMRVRLKKTVSC